MLKGVISHQFCVELGMSIKQVNATYLVQEDRILFRFNTQDKAEYLLWFTRRVTLFFLVATSHLLTKNLEQAHSPDAAKALNEFEKQAILESATHQNSDSQTYESGSHFPIGSDPLLVMDVSCSLMKNDKKLAYIQSKKEGEIESGLSIDFSLPGGANLNLKLAGNILQAMCVLLDQLRQQAGWGDAVLQVHSSESSELNLDPKNSKNTSIH